ERVRVPDGGDGERNEAAGDGAAPLVDVPVVVRLGEREGGLLVVEGGEQAAGEAGERGEVERPEDTVGVHVEDALLDVEAALADLLEAGRVDAVLLGRPARHRVEPDVGNL